MIFGDIFETILGGCDALSTLRKVLEQSSVVGDKIIYKIIFS